MLTDGNSRNTSHRYSDDGRRLAYASTLRNGADTDIYVMDPDEPHSARRVLGVQGGGWFPAAWSPDGKYLVVEDRRSVHDSSLYLLEVSTGAKQLLTSEQGSYGNAQFARNGKGLFLTTDRGSECEDRNHGSLALRESIGQNNVPSSTIY